MPRLQKPKYLTLQCISFAGFQGLDSLLILLNFHQTDFVDRKIQPILEAKTKVTEVIQKLCQNRSV